MKKDDDSKCCALAMEKRMGFRDVGIHEYGHTLSSRCELEETFKFFGQGVISMSSGSSESGRDDEDPRKNQKGSGYVESSINNSKESHSVPHNFDSAIGMINSSCLRSGSADIIVLSDSEEDKIGMRTPESTHNMYPIYDSDCSLLAPLGILDPYPYDQGCDAGLTSFGMPQWPFSSGSQAGPQIQLHGTDSDVSDALNDFGHVSNPYSAPMNAYKIASKSTVDSGEQILASSVCYSDDGVSDSLIDNCLAFVDKDHSLQHFLPTQLAGTSSQYGLGEQDPVTDGIHGKHHTSLRIGSIGEDGGRTQANSTTTNGQELKNWFGSNEASLLKDMNDEGRQNS